MNFETLSNILRVNPRLSRRGSLVVVGASLSSAACRPQPTGPECIDNMSIQGAMRSCYQRGHLENGSFYLDFHPDRLITDPNFFGSFPLNDDKHEIMVWERESLSPRAIRFRFRLQTMPNYEEVSRGVNQDVSALTQSPLFVTERNQRIRQVFTMAYYNRPSRDDWTVVVENVDISGKASLALNWQNWTFKDLRFKDQFIARSRQNP